MPKLSQILRRETKFSPIWVFLFSFSFHPFYLFSFLSLSLHFSKGPLSNSELLVERGYIDEDNRFDYITFPRTLFGVDPEDPIATKKEELIAEIRDKQYVYDGFASIFC
jgi:hypothetical protein